MLQRRVYRSRRPIKVDSPLPRLEVASWAEAMTNKRRKRAPGSCESCRPNDRLRASKRRAERIMHFGRLIGHRTTIIVGLDRRPQKYQRRNIIGWRGFARKRVRTTQAKGHDFNSLFATKVFGHRLSARRTRQSRRRRHQRVRLTPRTTRDPPHVTPDHPHDEPPRPTLTPAAPEVNHDPLHVVHIVPKVP